MKRREVVLLIGSAAAWPAATLAQQPKQIVRIGYLGTGPVEPSKPFLDAFRQGLRELGYFEGKNVLVEYRTADANIAQLPALVNELIRIEVDVIVAQTTPIARVAQQASTTIPIIVAVMSDPVRDGLV